MVMVAGFGAGHVADHADVLRTLEAFARQAGASSIQTYCRNPAMVRHHRHHRRNRHRARQHQHLSHQRPTLGRKDRAVNRYPRETVELVPLAVTVDGVAATIYDTALVTDGDRPTVWTP